MKEKNENLLTSLPCRGNILMTTEPLFADGGGE